MGRTFRNEGVSYKHNPEFTMLEAYQAFADYDVMLGLTRELIQGAATSAAFGVPVAAGTAPKHHISGPWPVKTVYGAISEALGRRWTPARPWRTCTSCATVRECHRPDDGPGDVVLEMYERLVEEKTLLPTFYKDFPTHAPRSPGSTALTRASPNAGTVALLHRNWAPRTRS